MWIAAEDGYFILDEVRTLTRRREILPTAEIKRGIKKRKIEDRKKPQGKNIMSASATQGGHNKSVTVVVFERIVN